MQGRNILLLNNATINEALAEYLNRWLAMGLQVKVTDVSEDKASLVFKVTTERMAPNNVKDTR